MSVLVIGDVMLDSYFHGKVERISQEAPVPIVRTLKYTHSLGGAANVYNNLKHLEVEVDLCGLIGDDTAGNQILNILGDRFKDPAEYIFMDKAISTTCKTRILAQKQQLLRFDNETIGEWDIEVYNNMIKKVLDIIPNYKVIIISDYRKNVFVANHFALNIIIKAKECGIPVLVDTKSMDWWQFAGAYCITPNLNEYLEANKFNSKIKAGINYTLVTKGADGMTLHDNKKRVLKHFPVDQPIDVADVSGAGDTVLAILAYGILNEMTIEESVELANKAGGIVVQKSGTQPITLEELFPQKTRVFINGCFDIIHPGHLHLFKEARKLGDVLIAGLNSDESIILNKGITRPINTYNSRKAILEEFVDVVVKFDEKTPITLLDSLKPDVVVKGSDYKDKNFPEKKLIEDYGGQIIYIDLLPNESTTKIVERIKNER